MTGNDPAACHRQGTTLRDFLPRDGITRLPVMRPPSWLRIVVPPGHLTWGIGDSTPKVAVAEIREALSAWLEGAGLRKVAERAGSGPQDGAAVCGGRGRRGPSDPWSLASGRLCQVFTRLCRGGRGLCSRRRAGRWRAGPAGGPGVPAAGRRPAGAGAAGCAAWCRRRRS